MVQWDKRAPEIANLLNPSFCAIILYAAIAEYQKKAKDGIPFPLVYLILPVVLHKSTRYRITSKTNMIVWLQRNPDVLVGFPERAKSLVPYTNEAIDFLLFQETCLINNEKICIAKTISQSGLVHYMESDEEIKECIQKAGNVGRWFCSMHATENIYAAWGVKP